MAIPTTETVAVVTAVNPAAGAAVGGGLAVLDAFGIRPRGATQHLSWELSNQKARASSGIINAYLKSKYTTPQIKQFVPFVVTELQGARNRWWIANRAKDIDVSIAQTLTELQNNPENALPHLLWIFFIWVNLQVGLNDAVDFSKAANQLWQETFIAGLNKSGVNADAAKQVAASTTVPYQWNITGANGATVSPLGGFPDLATAGVPLVIGLGLVGALVFMLFKKGG